MSAETIALLRTILYQLETADDLSDAIRAVKVMCSKDDIAAVEQEVEERKKEKAKKNEPI